MRTAATAIQQPNKAAIKESTVAQDVHNVHVFTANALTVAIRLIAVTTKAGSVLRASALF